ncbi:MAG: hypothetical protein K0R59_91 [Sphingobacterium sp.]|jgi:hypothetical protein|nr:hypothetical protein [Sphingobacterium sp.]
MKKKLFICFTLLLFGFTSVNAQGILDKVERALDKTDKAAGQADRGNRTVNKITGLFGKKKKNTGTEIEGSRTTIRLSGISFAALKSLNMNLQKSKVIANTKMKYKASGSTIVVHHSGSTEELLKNLEKLSPAIFSEHNIESLEEGDITVNVQ